MGGPHLPPQQLLRAWVLLSKRDDDDRVKLWNIIHDLGANSLRRFEMEKHIRSNDFGLQGCYFIRKLAINMSEPQRSYSLQAIDRAIKFWKGPVVRRRLPLRAPWLLTPQWKRRVQRLLTCGPHPHDDPTQHHHADTVHFLLSSPNTPR